MSSKVIVFFALLAVAFAEKPYLGFRIPQFDFTQVVGGEEAPAHHYPFMMSLQDKNGRHYCAASIISTNAALTAAHCMQSNEEVFIKVGKHNIKATENTEQTSNVAKAIVHENYQGGVGPFDIAVIKLKTSLNFTNEVQPIALPTSKPTENLILCGWGSTSQSHIPNMPDKLQHVNLTLVDLETCSKAVERLTGSSPVHETNICTGPMTGGTSACSGDSGGPLFQKSTTNSNFVLAGIVSWGIIPCGTVGAPSVYTGVYNYIDWIKQNM